MYDALTTEWSKGACNIKGNAVLYLVDPQDPALIMVQVCGNATQKVICSRVHLKHTLYVCGAASFPVRCFVTQSQEEVLH